MRDLRSSGQLAEAVLVAVAVICASDALAFSSRVVNSFPAPSAHPCGLAFGNGILFVSDYETKTVYRLNPETGSALSSYVPAPLPDGNVYGLAFYDTRLWANAARGDQACLYKMRPATGSVIASYVVAGLGAAEGIAFYESYAYVANNSPTDFNVYKFHPATGTVVKSWPGGKWPGGLTVITLPEKEEQVLLNSGTVDGWVYVYGLEGQRYEGYQFKIAVTCPEFQYRGDLAGRDGNHIFFASDYFDRIYELKIKWSDPAVAPTSLGRVKSLFR
jgi:DNA-binding beta-propeller fold protein YncE